jgi:type IV secretory pathway VirB10-like protein
MKQCPECKQHFADSQNFCDADGSPLRDDTELLREALQSPAETIPTLPGQKIWPIVTIGILIGVIICLGVYVVMLTRPTENVETSKKPETAKLNTSNQFAQPVTIRPEALPSPTAEEAVAEESPTESPTPTPVEVVNNEPSPSLNEGAISTNRQEGEKRGRTIIKLKSGVRVEADAAWEDRMGIWYRQGGLVSYVERDRIESIGEPAQPKTSPTQNDKP